MRPNKTILLIILAILIQLISCPPPPPPIYVPNDRNIPLLTRANETKIAVLPVLFGVNGDIELLAAHATSKHFALMMNGHYSGEYKDEKQYSKCWLGEVGAGFYFPFRQHYVLELYGGYGLGMNKQADYDFSSYTNIGKYHRFFIQPGIGITTKLIEIGLAWRFSYVSFIDFHYEGRNKPQWCGYWFYEPARTFKIGWKGVKLYQQIGGAIPFLKDKIDFGYTRSTFSMGLEFDIVK